MSSIFASTGQNTRTFQDGDVVRIVRSKDSELLRAFAAVMSHEGYGFYSVFLIGHGTFLSTHESNLEIYEAREDLTIPSLKAGQQVSVGKFKLQAVVIDTDRLASVGLVTVRFIDDADRMTVHVSVINSESIDGTPS
jgi:hypothetical protein